MIPTALFPCTDAKRLIGRKFDDAVVQSDMKYWPFKVVDDGGKPKVEVEYKGEIKTFNPEEISSMVLTKMKEISEAYLGKVKKGIMVLFLFNCGGIHNISGQEVQKKYWHVFYLKVIGYLNWVNVSTVQC